MSWCAFYRNIYMMEEDKRPPSRYIDNDYALDRWMEQREHRDWHEQNVKTTEGQGSQVFDVVG